MTVFERFGVDPVINAAGKMTALGGSAQAAEVAAAQAEAATAHVDIAALRARAGEVIAARTEAEAACVTTGAAAGIVISVAACIAGSDPDRVARLPDSDGMVNRVVLQAGHAVNFGAPVEQMVRLAGGRPVIAGTRVGVSADEVGSALEEAPCAALLYVQSHHAAQEGIVPLEDCIELAHARRTPVIVDAAAEEDLRRYVRAGVDLVTYSGGKAFGGPTVGFIAGRRDFVAACEAQGRGIARPMKVGKEQIAGLLVALERYEATDAEAEVARRRRVNAIVRETLEGIGEVEVSIRMDEAGRPIERVAVHARAGGFDVRDLVRFLAEGTPSIRTRNHHLDDGLVTFDPREVTEPEAYVIAERLRVYFAQRP